MIDRRTRKNTKITRCVKKWFLRSELGQAVREREMALSNSTTKTRSVQTKDLTHGTESTNGPTSQQINHSDISYYTIIRAGVQYSKSCLSWRRAGIASNWCMETTYQISSHLGYGKLVPPHPPPALIQCDSNFLYFFSFWIWP